jgi:hypothetical protein
LLFLSVLSLIIILRGILHGPQGQIDPGLVPDQHVEANRYFHHNTSKMQHCIVDTDKTEINYYLNTGFQWQSPHRPARVTTLLGMPRTVLQYCTLPARGSPGKSFKPPVKGEQPQCRVTTTNVLYRSQRVSPVRLISSIIAILLDGFLYGRFRTIAASVLCETYNFVHHETQLQVLFVDL